MALEQLKVREIATLATPFVTSRLMTPGSSSTVRLR